MFGSSKKVNAIHPESHSASAKDDPEDRECSLDIQCEHFCEFSVIFPVKFSFVSLQRNLQVQGEDHLYIHGKFTDYILENSSGSWGSSVVHTDRTNVFSRGLPSNGMKNNEVS